MPSFKPADPRFSKECGLKDAKFPDIGYTEPFLYAGAVYRFDYWVDRFDPTDPPDLLWYNSEQYFVYDEYAWLNVSNHKGNDQIIDKDTRSAWVNLCKVWLYTPAFSESISIVDFFNEVYNEHTI